MAGSRFINQKGFSLMEVLMALGVLSLISLGVGVAISSLFHQQQKITTTDSGDNFTSAFFQHLLMQTNCNAALTGRNVPSGSSEVNLNVNTFLGMNDLATNTIQANTQIDRNLFVNRLYMRRKPGSTVQKVLIGPVTENSLYVRDKHTIQVILQLERRATGETSRPSPERILEIPVYTAQNALPIQGCYLEASLEDLCEATGGTVAENGQCTPAGQCLMQGTYIQTTCNDTPCSPEYQGPDRNNSTTGRAQCPTGSCPVQSGKFEITRSIQTGKKSSKTITVTENFYICMACPGVTCPGGPGAAKKN